MCLLICGVFSIYFNEVENIFEKIKFHVHEVKPVLPLLLLILSEINNNECASLLKIMLIY